MDENRDLVKDVDRLDSRVESLEEKVDKQEDMITRLQIEKRELQKALKRGIHWAKKSGVNFTQHKLDMEYIEAVLIMSGGEL
jgi:hypothetical protein